jgi:NADPH:quinone reductase-like Zn-dependent oxidoreductase
MKAVRIEDYGGVEVLDVRDVARPQAGPDQVLVAVRAAGINPSEGKMRAGLVREIFPLTFPSGQGSDLAGVVEEVGAGVTGVAVGDEVIGYSNNRASHAEYVLVEAANLTAKPSEVPWTVAGSLFVAGSAGVGTVRAVAPAAGEAVVIAGAGGRGWRVRGTARGPDWRARDRTGQRAPSRMAARARRGSRRLRRWRQ